MTIVVYSASESFKRHINYAVAADVCHKSDLIPLRETADIYLVQITSYGMSDWQSFIADSQVPVDKIAIADDIPGVEAMLRYTQQGIRAYCNSYMAAPHYQQLIQLLNNKQSWYPPELLTQALSLAHQSVDQALHESYDEKLQLLTPREKQIALSVGEGKSNKVVALEYDISERTVKAHLTHIFEKWNIKDRMELVIYLKQHRFAKTGT